MDIHFCSVCNESIPQPDLDAGRAIQRGKGLVCAACESAMAPPGAAAVPPPATGTAGPGTAALVEAPQRPAGGARGALLLACAALGGTGYLWWRAEQEAALRRDAAQAERQRAEALAQETRSVEAQLAELRRTLGEERAAARTAAADEARRGGELQAQLGDARAALAALAARADEADRLRERLARLEALSPRMQDLEGKLRAFGEERAALLARIAQLEGAVQEAAQRPTLEAAPAAPARPSWDTRLADLTSPSEATRLEAVLALSSTKDPAVVPHLVPRLKDENLFVRTATARALGELRTLDQAGALALCDALLDAEAPVREAAWVALRAVTGFNLAYDPLGGDAERARRAKAWREQVEKGPPPAGAPAQGG